MESAKYHSLATLNSAEERAERELRFTVVCKNDGRSYEYDLSRKVYAENFGELLGVVAWALYRLRHSQGHLTRVSIMGKMSRFFSFLNSINIFRPEKLNSATIIAYAEWLKCLPGISYATAGAMFRSTKSLLIEMSRHPKINEDFIPPRNAFPKSSELMVTSNGYDQAELKMIVNAAVKGMRESAAKLENIYKPKWIDLPPPIDDVAPETDGGGHSAWVSLQYRIWWWENNCRCEQLKTAKLLKMAKGQSFYKWMSPSGKGSVALLNKFYQEIGAGKNYEPKYQGQPAPIKYLSPWQKKDYLVWFWENKLNCLPLSGPEAKKLSPDFYGAIRDHYGGSFRAFFTSLGVERWVQPVDLIPYYLMLLIRTQLNPSTIQRLTVNCLVRDPLDENRFSIDWTKFRSFNRGRTIPVNIGNDSWPVMLIKRISNITRPIRDLGQEDLWIANHNKHRKSTRLGSATFEKGLRDFSQRYKIIGTNGKPLNIKANLIRPTIAWNEYLRTEDMMYLRTLLGHSKLATTADYLRRLDDPILHTRRAIHQKAMFLGLTGEEAESQKLIAHENLLSHCKEPLNSPISGQRLGQYCSGTHEVCLGCQNLVVTLVDIKKYFCFIAFHDYLLQVGDITDDEYSKAASEKKFIWTEYILPKYDTELIERIKTDAQLHPTPVWDISIYEGGKT